jgi:hypothetical protein
MFPKAQSNLRCESVPAHTRLQSGSNHSLKCCPIFAALDNSLSAPRRSSVTSATHTCCKLLLRRLRCGVFLHPQSSEQAVKFVRPFVDVRNLVGVRSTYASVAIRRPRYGNRQIWQPFARPEGIAWQIIHDRLGRRGSPCNRRLALFYRASGLVSCRLVSRVSRRRPLFASACREPQCSYEASA